LKQAQFSPVAVEEQVAIIFASTKGFTDKVPLERIKEYEKDYLNELKLNHRDTLESLKKSVWEDAEQAVLKKVALEVANKFAK